MGRRVDMDTEFYFQQVNEFTSAFDRLSAELELPPELADLGAYDERLTITPLEQSEGDGWEVEINDWPENGDVSVYLLERDGSWEQIS